MSRRRKNKREDETRKVKKKSGVLKKILLILLIVLIGLTGFVVYRTQKNGGGMQGLLSTLVGHDENTLKELDTLQVLLMGVSTDNGLKLTDTIIVGSYDPKTQKASLLSIPRDTFVGKNIKTGGGNDKINSLYQRGGAEKTLEAVNEITGLDLKYYMVIDNQALIKLVDVIGGVEFEVPYVPGGMVYDDPSQDLHINLEPGLQLIDGNKAEQLLRFRKNNKNQTYPEEYGGDDYGRMRTQREFIIATAKQTIQAKNVFKIGEIVDLVYEYVDTNLSISAIKDYIPYAINVDINGIQSAYLPGVSVGPPQGVPYWFFQVDEEETEELVQQLYYSTDTTVPAGENGTEDSGTDSTSGTSSSSDNNTTSGTDTTSDNTSSSSTDTVTKKEAGKIKIEILNGSGSSEKLSQVKKDLTAKGYKISRTSTTTSTSKTTIINKTDVDEKYENNVKEILGLGNVSSSSVSSSNVDITIIIGKDYK